MNELRRYHADVEVTLRYHDAVYASSEVMAKERFRRAVESLFEDLNPTILDVDVLNTKMVPEEEDVVL